MDERVVQFRVGVTVMATLIIVGILIVLFGEVPGMGREKYTVRMKFAQAPGVSRDTPVRKSGLLVGRVVDIGFADDGEVWVTADMDSEVPVSRGEVPYIKGSLLGDAEVQFRPVQDAGGERVPLRQGDVLEGEVEGDPLRMLGNLEGNFNRAIGSLSGAGDEVNKLARNLNDLLLRNHEQINRIVNKTESSLDSFQTAMANIDEILGDEKLRADLKQSLSQLPILLQETNETVQGIQGVVGSADRNLANLERFTKPLGDRGEQLIAKVDSSVSRLDELLAQLVAFSGSLNNREGSLGRLVNDPDVYQQLNEAATNINQLTRDLEPILKDARVFTDKIARHPEVLGARGAIRPSTGIK